MTALDAGRAGDVGPRPTATSVTNLCTTFSTPHRHDASHPYASAVDEYLDAGWWGVIPLRGKLPAITGVTGHDAPDRPTVEQYAIWKRHYAASNIGLRMVPRIIGIDVDGYDGRPGMAHWRSILANLRLTEGIEVPPTWISTSRIDGTGNGSGIRLYRTDLRFPGKLPNPLYPDAATAIEVLQRHHRFAVVWPSIHPKTGQQYRWVDPDGDVVDRVPRLDEIPELPLGSTEEAVA